MKFERVVLSRSRGWRKPENTVVVSRPSPFGNPFRVVPLARNKSWTVVTLIGLGGHAFLGCTGGSGGKFYSAENARLKAVELYEAWLHGDTHSTDAVLPKDFLVRVRDELRGKNLACWCPLGQACHADVLLRLANDDMSAALS
jgi:hypothetical protein